MAAHRLLAATLAVVSTAALAFALPPQSANRPGQPLPAQQPFPEISARGNSRIFYWGGATSGGQVRVEFGTPDWQDAYDQQIDKQLGVRWRLGKNFWTQLDTNMDLKAGDVDIAAGLYSLVLERRKDDKQFVLWLLDPVEIRDARLDAFHAPKTEGGIAVPLEHRTAALRSDKLQLRLDLDKTRKEGANLVIHFGPHELVAKLTMQPTRG